MSSEKHFFSVSIYCIFFCHCMRTYEASFVFEKAGRHRSIVVYSTRFAVCPSGSNIFFRKVSYIYHTHRFYFAGIEEINEIVHRRLELCSTIIQHIHAKRMKVVQKNYYETWHYHNFRIFLIFVFGQYKMKFDKYEVYLI